MPRSDEAEAFIYGVYMAVQEIPYGKVTTYGHIARLIGKPECPRQVGQALKHLPPADGDTDFHAGNVPWQRVVSADGRVPRRDAPGGAALHAQALRAEGVEVDATQLRVNLSVVGWFPEALDDDDDDSR